MTSSAIPKTNVTDLTLSNEKIQDYTKLDLEIFSETPIWSDEYLSELNLSRRPFDFQIEIVQSVIRSGNSIISLRTGAGKTNIAALLIKYYYMKKRKENNQNEFLSFFFIPNRSICDQQVKAIRDIGDLRVTACDDDSYVHEFVGFNHVIVCTPQKFLNSLLEKTIHLNHIDLIVFDECHNCIGNHVYSKIMEQYLVYHQSEYKPKILGLTASCGTKLTNPEVILEELKDENKRKYNALSKLYELCATLNCYNVVTVNKAENLDELDKKIPKPTEDKILDFFSSPFHQYRTELEEKFIVILSYIGCRCSPVIVPSTEEQKLIEKKLEAEGKNQFENIILIKYMIMFVKRLDALKHLPLKSIMTDIIKKLNVFYNKKERPLEIETHIHDFTLQQVHEIIEQIEQTEYYLTNPKLDYLTGVVQKLIQERENARGLILVARTLHAKLLFDYFKERQDIQSIIKPCWLVGQNGVDYQNSLSEQYKTLTDFRKGLSNVMIATDIVQEGLDVPECSFIIRYEFVSNEIGTVQSRGRARADKSSCFLIVDLGSKNYEKEWKNRLKEREMSEALEKWKQLQADQLISNIQNIQNAIITAWRQEAAYRDLKAASLLPPDTIDGKVSCRSCDYYLGEISWIRRRNLNYFVRQQKVVDRIEIVRFSIEKIIKEIQLNGKIRCGNKQCREELGGLQLFRDRPDVKEICALKCKQLKFSYRNEDGEPKVVSFKKWTDVDFKILDLEPISS